MMPPITQGKNLRLYRLYYLIVKKVEEERRTKKEVIDDIIRILGVSKHHFYKIHNCRIGSNGFLSVPQLTSLAEYFKCTIDDLINKDLHASLPVSTSDQNASSDAGHFNSIDNEE